MILTFSMVVLVAGLWSNPLVAQPPSPQSDPGGSGYDPGYSEEDMLGYSEEDMLGSYDSGYGGSRRRGGSTSDVVANLLTSTLGSVSSSGELSQMLSPDAAPPVQSGPVLSNESLVAYSIGNYPLAMELYFGHMVAEYENASNELNLAKFSRLMKRPVWQLRWGISYTVRGEATDPQPIRESATRGGGFDSSGFAGEEGDMAMQEQMMQQQMMQEEQMMQQQMMQEEQMMQEQMMQEQMMMENSFGSGMGGRRNNNAPLAPPTPAERLASGERTMLSEAVETELDETLGLVIAVLGEELSSRYAQGDFGRAMTDITAESGVKETISAAFVDAVESSPEPLPLWRPGIQFVGKDASDQNTLVARKAGIDLMLHFDVLLKPIRGDFVQNICRCRLIHVPTGKSLGVSKSIDSLEFAQKTRLRGMSGREYVSEQLSNLMGIIDREVKTIDLPALTPEVAKRRIGTLLASGGGKNLRTLAEVRLYQSLNLLSEPDVLMAFDIVGGEEALQMVYGPEEERLALVHQWAVKRPPAEATE
ncbi:hypothetical protein FYK55_21930 [Roseiconus nitratireducens]|uniref:Uncharacterized protein n=1 Tax=Roseiconus nitratireducens TaxID=2605748 RepID=A0A5M6CYH9_9BACT|nr:hypothetical protein [Roseiconus nitratireducens]KAA5540287.1 hypothetical protein FYK55_21930 [Roseiconus nitratireducens]